MEIDSEIYDGWLWTAHNWRQQSLYLMYQKCSATIHFPGKKLSHLRSMKFYDTKSLNPLIYFLYQNLEQFMQVSILSIYPQ